MSDFEKRVGLIEVEVDNNEARKKVSELTDAILRQKDIVAANNDQIKSLNKSNADLRKSVKSGEKSYQEAKKEIVENTNRVRDLKKENAFLSDELKDLNGERRNAVKATKLQSNSLDALRDKSSKLKKDLNGLNTETKEGKERFTELQDELEKTNAQIQKADQGAGDFKTTIGNYPGFLGSAVDGIKGLTQSALAFIATPLGIFLGMVAGAFMLVKNALERNEDLMFKVQKALAPLESAFQMVLKAMQPFAEFLIDGIVVGLQAATKAFDWFIGILADGADLLGFEDAAKGIREYNEEVKATGELATDIVKMTRSLQELNRALVKNTATLEGQIEIQQQIADDATLSFEAQKKGAEEVLKLQEKLFKEKTKVAQVEKNRIDAIVEQASLEGKVSQDLLDQQAEATAELKRLDNDYKVFVQTNAQLRRQIAQDVWEQDLDFAIDVGTRRTEEALRAAENEKLSFEERKAQIEEARRLDEEAFNNQLTLFEEVGLSREKINELVNESNAEVIASELKKTELSEIERNRFRELVLERQALTEAIADSESSLSDAIAESSEEQLAKKKELNEKLLALDKFRREQANEELVGQTQDLKEKLEIRRAFLEEEFENELSRLEEEREILKENEELSREDKLIRQAEFDLQIEELKAAHSEKMISLNEQEKQTLLQQETEFEENKAKVNATGQKAIEIGIGVANKRVSKFYQRRFNDLEKQFQEGLISEAEYEQKKESLQKQAAISAWKVDKKNFEIQRGLGIASALASTAVGVAKELRKGIPVGLVTSGIVAAKGAAEIATIRLQQGPQRPTFAQGGDVMSFLAGGKDHSAGGTNYFGEDGNSFNVQRGEGIFVTKREATNPALQLLDRANTAYGGRSMFESSARFLQEGGSVAQGNSFSTEEFAEVIANMPTPVLDIETVMGGIEADSDARRVGEV